jgi:three-Cys-motif partner protein
MGNTTDEFWDEQSEKSAIKTAIVANFFDTYIRIITNRFSSVKQIYYIDLFSGPGRYKDGKESTPLQVFNKINSINSNVLNSKIQFVFNDYNKKLFKQLLNNLTSHPLYNNLKSPPLIFNLEADQIDLSKYLKSNEPVFSFVDPFGYKGTSVEQIWRLVKNRGSDCIFFFNANRFIMDVPKDKESEFKSLFGEYYEELKLTVYSNDSHFSKMKRVLQLFSKNVVDMAKQASQKFELFILPFAFCFDDRGKQSHYLLFITKNHKAVIEMKKVMSKLSNSINDEMGYDSKKVNQLSIFQLTNDTSTTIIKTIITIHSKYSLCEQAWTVLELLEFVDKKCMKIKTRVSPFTEKEFKIALKCMYDKGYMNDTFSFRANEDFSNMKKFTLIKEKME